MSAPIVVVAAAVLLIVASTADLSHLQSLARWRKRWQLTMLRQPTSCNLVRVGKAVEAPAVKLCGDHPRLCRQLWTATWLSQGGRRSRLLPGKDLPPPIVVWGGNPSATAETLTDRNAAIHWPFWQAAHQLGARLAASPPPLRRTLTSTVRTIACRGCGGPDLLLCLRLHKYGAYLGQPVHRSRQRGRVAYNVEVGVREATGECAAWGSPALERGLVSAHRCALERPEEGPG